MITGRPFLAALTAASLLVSAPVLAGPPDDPAPERKGDEPSKESDLVRSILAAHNRERAEAKLSPLSLDPKLTAAAEGHAKDMAEHAKMTHDGSDGSTPTDRIKRQDYHYATIGENVAEGYPKVEALMRGWMESPPHRENILGKFTQAGIGIATDDEKRPYYCVDFGTPTPKLDPARAAEELVEALNKVRSNDRLPPLKPSPKLHSAAAKVAQAYAAADSLDLKERSVDLLDVLKRLGYKYLKLAESAASGQPTAEDVVKTWMESPNHKAHILDDFTEVGIGYARSRTDTPFWCLVLARPARR